MLARKCNAFPPGGYRALAQEIRLLSSHIVACALWKLLQAPCHCGERKGMFRFPLVSCRNNVSSFTRCSSSNAVNTPAASHHSHNGKCCTKEGCIGGPIGQTLPTTLITTFAVHTNSPCRTEGQGTYVDLATFDEFLQDAVCIGQLGWKSVPLEFVKPIALPCLDSQPLSCNRHEGLHEIVHRDISSWHIATRLAPSGPDKRARQHCRPRKFRDAATEFQCCLQ